ncbi:MAG: (E)-4-hydroxy-3-methylbut-2-enyl-diphosphate synthase [Bacteroidota bacterium]|nr:(E)-4-hydroxy-3-methylbut-2-enyl-diphosphate synthase [Bacteroidota bacterium]
MSQNIQIDSFFSREVFIGEIPLGGKNSVRVQSMTNTDPADIEATVNQIIELSEAGSEYVRITIPAIKNAKDLKAIKELLKKKNCNVPIITDVHFNPKVAKIAARIVEKVRINPGNFAEIKQSKKDVFTEKENNEALEKIKIQFSSLINICKKHNTALRIGTNHGSLSERILNRFGNTPLGMAESALEYLRICQELDFHNIVLSMKASNPQFMIEACRILVNKMKIENMNYPLHLGVTEAGEGEDARIKSAIGIGTLLLDGIGDTIRVSLAEDPVEEIPFAKALVENCKKRQESNSFVLKNKIFNTANTSEIKKLSDKVIVISDFSSQSKTKADFYFIENIESIPKTDKKIIYKFDKNIKQLENLFPLFNSEQYLKNKKPDTLHFLKISNSDFKKELLEEIKKNKKLVIVLKEKNNWDYWKSFSLLSENEINNPVVLFYNADAKTKSKLLIDSSLDLGSILIEGAGNGIWINGDYEKLSFDILQASKRRISKTEFVICPTCGRTSYNLQKVSLEIKAKLSHLKGLQIGIMGCIVNGLGEMGDADYGFIGSVKNKVNLYRKKDLVKSNIYLKDAVSELVKLIKTDGKWVEDDQD